MPYVPVLGVAMVEMRCLFAGQQMENTIYLMRDDLSADQLTIAELQDIANKMEDWWQTEIAPLVVNDVTLSEVFVTDLTTETASTWSLTSGAVGLDAGTPLPTSVSFVITFTTSERGRSSRNRNYLIGIPQGATSSPTLMASADATAFRDAYAALNSYLVGGVGVTTWLHAMVSRYSEGQPREEGFATPVTGYRYADLYLDVRRPRAGGRGS